MSAVFKCPACDGLCRRARKEGGKKKRCRACDGSGVIVIDAASKCTLRHYPKYYEWWHQPYLHTTFSDTFYTSGTTGVDAGITAHNVATSVVDTALTEWRVS